jgi:hypothetical protein
MHNTYVYKSAKALTGRLFSTKKRGGKKLPTTEQSPNIQYFAT